MNEKISRRGFLGELTVAGAGLVVPKILLPEEEPIRRFWQVPIASPFGRPLTHPGFFKDELEPIADLDLDAPVTGGLIPIKGQPGLFRDAATGQIVNIRDFREDAKWDTVIVGADAELEKDTEIVFFQDIQGRRNLDSNKIKALEEVENSYYRTTINEILEGYEDDEIIKFPGGRS